MDDPFTKKVRAAAVAGWWTLLIVAGVGLVQWLLYLVIVSSRPDWLLALWGGGVMWSTVITMWMWSMAAFKIAASH